ncbi:MAG: tRNA pseudouridine(38-40) synthase TruA [Pseudomonadota bacterium]
MPRYRVTVEYDGTPFVGWQRQPNGPSVQEALENAGHALSGVPAPVYGAGRTDAGVHALGMTAHIDLQKAYPPRTVKGALNAHLRPLPIAVLDAEEAPENFHARFSCRGRHYLYRVLNRRSPAALLQKRVWNVAPPMDVAPMVDAAQTLVGKHDFTTFRSTQCQAESPVKTLSTFTVERVGEEITFKLFAPSFLHNQVRSLVGTLVQVGLGRWSVGDVAAALTAKDRSRCGPVAPANGLYFVKADYGDNAF